jgi:hypothetical protein
VDAPDDVIDTTYPHDGLHDDEMIASAAAATTVVRLATEDHATVLKELATRLHSARRAEYEARFALRQAALSLIHSGGRGIYSELGFAEVAGVSRMSVREWLGKR